MFRYVAGCIPTAAYCSTHSCCSESLIASGTARGLQVLNPAKAASRVVSHLTRCGKTVYCVNPSSKTVETETLKRSLEALPVIPDVVNLIIHPALGPDQMQMAAKLGIMNVFVQPVSKTYP